MRNVRFLLLCWWIANDFGLFREFKKSCFFILTSLLFSTGFFKQSMWARNRVGIGLSYRAGIFKQSMRARNRVGIGLSYRPARLHSPGGTGRWKSILGLLLKVWKFCLRFMQRDLASLTRNRLQLTGVAAMLVASKYEEIYAPEVRVHRLNTEVDVTWCAQLSSLAETPQPSPPPAFGLVLRGRYWSAKIDDISLYRSPLWESIFRVVDPHWYNADPDTAFFLIAVPDPDPNTDPDSDPNADPDPDPGF